MTRFEIITIGFMLSMSIWLKKHYSTTHGCDSDSIIECTSHSIVTTALFVTSVVLIEIYFPQLDSTSQILLALPTVIFFDTIVIVVKRWISNQVPKN